MTKLHPVTQALRAQLRLLVAEARRKAKAHGLTEKQMSKEIFLDTKTLGLLADGHLNISVARIMRAAQLLHLFKEKK